MNLDDLILLTVTDVLEYHQTDLGLKQLSHIVCYRINTFSDYITNIVHVQQTIKGIYENEYSHKR